MYARAAPEQSGLPALTGEKEDLPLRAQPGQIVQGGRKPGVVKGQEGIVQNQGRILLRRQDHFADGQADGQIELVGGACAEKLNAAAGGVAAGLGGEMELPVQENVAPGAAGHVRENFRGSAPQLRGEAVLQGGVGGLKRIQGEPEGVVFRLLPDKLLLQAGDLVSQRLGIPPGVETALNLEETLYLFGETGTVKIGGTSTNNIDVWNFADETEDDQKNKGLQEATSNVYGNGHTSLFADMMDAIEHDRKPYVDAVAGRNALEMILAIYQSAATGKPVKLPLSHVASTDFTGRFGK